MEAIIIKGQNGYIAIPDSEHKGLKKLRLSLEEKSQRAVELKVPEALFEITEHEGPFLKMGELANELNLKENFTNPGAGPCKPKICSSQLL